MSSRLDTLPDISLGFVFSSSLRQVPSLTKRQYQSHTWTHADISKLSTSELNQQLDLIETALMKILGVKPKYFRPPYGSYNSKALAVLKSRGYKGG
jgi:peptidoglycan/xylan/chitin deacetylase (PgdA/CDA1 family)